MRLLLANDWERIRKAMKAKRTDSIYHHDMESGYTVRVYVDQLSEKIARVRGQDMVLTVSMTFPNGNTSTQNFDSVEEAMVMLYG